MKPFTKLTTAILSSLLLLLGFGGCKSSKKAAKNAEEQQLAEEIARIDSIAKSMQDSVRIRQAPRSKPILKPDDPTRVRALYGVAPVQFRKKPE